MNRYPSYKPSGVKWLGEIPSHWEVKRLASYFTERRVKVSDKDYEPLSVTKLGIFPQWENVAKTNDGDNRKLVKKGDFVINSRSDRKGSSGVSDRDGSVSLINIVLQPRKTILAQYSNYLLKSYRFIEEYYRNGRGIVADLWTTRYDEMKMIKLAIPPLKEQEAIANYLDRATAKIDAAIAQQQKMIDLLNERKQIIINRAVTKGFNPNGKMKDSGMEWIGEVPEGWEVKKLKFLVSCNDESLSENERKDLKINYIEIGDVDSVDGVRNYTEYAYKDAPSRARRITRKGDVIVSTVRTYLRAIAPVEEEGFVVSTGFAVLRAKNVIDKDFLAFSLMSDCFVCKVISESVGTSYPAINATDLLDIKIALPSLEVQKQIVVELKNKTLIINKIIDFYNHQIQLLQERKQIIINEVVTGKVKVG